MWITESYSLLSVSCYRLVTNFQETNRQQETHARRDERTVISKPHFHVEMSLLIPNFFSLFLLTYNPEAAAG